MEDDMQVAPSAMSQVAAQPYASQFIAPAQAIASPPPETANEPGGQNAYGGEVDVQA
jgi:hypothetical protein